MKGVPGLGISLIIVLVVAVLGGCSQEGTTPILSGGPQAYKLVGIIQADPEHAGAIFEEVKTKQQRLYRVGEVIDGATVIDIQRQQVLLKHGEEITVAYLVPGSPGKNVPGELIPVPVGLGDPRKARKQVLSQVIPPYDPKVEKTSILRSEIDQFVADLWKGLEDEAIFVTTSDLGPAVSLAGVNQDVLRSLGLAPTDLIVGISGIGIDSPERLAQIFGILGRAKVLNLSVIRGDLVEPLYYEVHRQM